MLLRWTSRSLVHSTCSWHVDRYFHKHNPTPTNLQLHLNMASTTITQEILNIAEILELILLGLDMQTLLHCQRVSIFWESSIMSSKALQRKLWLLPNDDHEGQHNLAQINPLILKYRKRLGISGIRGQSIDDTEDVYAFKVPYVLDHGYRDHGDLLYLQSGKSPSPGSWQQMIVMASSSKAVAYSFCTVGLTNIMWISCGIFVHIEDCWGNDYGRRSSRSAVLSSGDRVITTGEVMRKKFGRLAHEYPNTNWAVRELRLCEQNLDSLRNSQ